MSGYGLTGMIDRAENCGGGLDIAFKRARPFISLFLMIYCLQDREFIGYVSIGRIIQALYLEDESSTITQG
jgi:hypothetical protein